MGIIYNFLLLYFVTASTVSLSFEKKIATASSCLIGKKKLKQIIATAGNRTRINGLGSRHDNHYTTVAGSQYEGKNIRKSGKYTMKFWTWGISLMRKIMFFKNIYHYWVNCLNPGGSVAISIVVCLVWASRWGKSWKGLYLPVDFLTCWAKVAVSWQWGWCDHKTKNSKDNQQYPNRSKNAIQQQFPQHQDMPAKVIFIFKWKAFVSRWC